jgi:hypothetical protein
MHVPQEENACQEYAPVFDEINRIEREDPEAFRELSRSLSTRIDRLDNYLDRIQSLVNLHEVALKKSFLRVDVTKERIHTHYQIGPPLRFLAKILVRRIEIAAKLGDLDAVRSHMDDLRVFVQHAQFDGTQLAWLIHLSIGSMYLGAINKVIHQMPKRADVLNWAQEALTSLPGPPPLLRAVKSNVAFGIAFWEKMEGKSLRKIGYSDFAASIPYFQTSKAYDAYLSRQFQESVRAIKNWPANESDWRRTSDLNKISRFSGKWWFAPSFALPNLLPKNWGIGRALASIAARRELARLGIDLHRYFNETGRFPRTLREASLTPAANLPFPVTYWPTDKDFVLRCGMISY